MKGRGLWLEAIDAYSKGQKRSVPPTTTPDHGTAWTWRRINRADYGREPGVEKITMKMSHSRGAALEAQVCLSPTSSEIVLLVSLRHPVCLYEGKGRSNVGHCAANSNERSGLD